MSELGGTPTADETTAAIDELVRDGLVERTVVDGETSIKLTPAGFERAARLVEQLGDSER